MLFIAFETAPFDWGIKVRADGFLRDVPFG